MVINALQPYRITTFFSFCESTKSNGASSISIILLTIFHSSCCLHIYYLFHLTFYVHTNIIKKIFLLFLQRNYVLFYEHWAGNCETPS